MNNLKQLGYEIFGRVSNYSEYYTSLFNTKDECSSQHTCYGKQKRNVR